MPTDMMHGDPAPLRDVPVTVHVADPADLGHGQRAGIPETWLDAREAARADSFRFRRDRDMFVAAHGLLRAALSGRNAAAVDPAAWRFAAGPHGKPRVVRAPGLPEPSDPRFSLSHTAGCVAVALCEGREVGIDVENIAAATATLELARTFCTAAELTGLAALAEGTAPMAARFFRLWTLKESLVKAAGHGLLRPLTCAGFRFDPFRLVHLDDDLRREGVWHVWSGELAPGHALALATILQPGERPRLSVHRIGDVSALAAGVAMPPPLSLALGSCSSFSAISEADRNSGRD